MKEQLQQIISRHTNSTLIDASPLVGGERASVYRLRTKEEDLCLKFHPTERGKSVLGMEYKLMEELGKLGVQTPIPMFLGKINFAGEKQDYLIMSFEEGRLLSEKWAHIDKRQKERISIKLLKILDIIKNVKVSGFGPLDQNLNGLCNSPSSYMQHEIEKLEKSDAFGQVKEEVFDRAKRKLLDSSSSMPKPKYVHADFRLRNFIVNGDDLILFDFANSMGMDPTFDFVRFILTDFSSEGMPNKEGQFLEQIYLKNYYRGKDYEYDKSIYLLLLSFRLTPWFYSVKKKKHLKSYLKLMDRHSL